MNREIRPGRQCEKRGKAPLTRRKKTAINLSAEPKAGRVSKVAQLSGSWILSGFIRERFEAKSALHHHTHQLESRAEKQGSGTEERPGRELLREVRPIDGVEGVGPRWTF